MVNIKDLTDEEELALLEEGIKTRFWAYIAAKSTHLYFTTTGVVLQQKSEHREWLAGKASGIKTVTTMPEERIRLLKTKISQKKSE